MELYVWKILSLLTILFVSISVGYTAFVLKKIPSRLTGVFSSFAGGTFLAIALLHLLPEGVEKLEEFKELPLGFLIALLGYLFILFIDKIAFDSHHLVTHGNRHVDLGVHNHKPVADEEENRLKHLISTRNRVVCHLGTGCGENCIALCESLTEPLLDNCHKRHTSYISSILLVFALCLHGILEGFAIGLQEDINDLINLVIAVTLHKVPEILALCISIGDMNQKHSITAVALLVMASPFGIVIGMLIMTYVSSFIVGILLSFTTGTFLYISASEIVVEEFAVSKNKWPKFCSLMFGVTIITLLLLLEGHE
ncbi:unnamed protein product [Blepharisma stoltei]|uniref:Uncharacterized protein n=1 Tax=Blepharisma stoltei TaxID=1481888 RepID=A0AAU9J599_9CILI|nr:unnamed protein product [Blepharisma stoltei]